MNIIFKGNAFENVFCKNGSHFVPASMCKEHHHILQLDSFTVLLHSTNGRQIPVVRAVQRHCQWHVKNIRNSNRSCEPTMQWDTRQSQPIFRPTNHKRVMPANWRPCLIPHWQSYCYQTVSQSILQQILFLLEAIAAVFMSNAIISFLSRNKPMLCSNNMIYNTLISTPAAEIQMTLWSHIALRLAL